MMDDDALIQRCNEAEELIYWLIVNLEDADQDCHYEREIREAKEWLNADKPEGHKCKFPGE